jgi:hypothetical protein
MILTLKEMDNIVRMTNNELFYLMTAAIEALTPTTHYCDHTEYTTLPILKICDIAVNVYLRVRPSRVTLIVQKKALDAEAREVYNFFDKVFEHDGTPDSVTNTISNVLFWLLDTLSKFKFDKFHGKFVTDETNDLIHVFSQAFSPSQFPTCEFSYSDCCVCLELTTSKTPCNHFLCFECEEKLSFDEMVEDGDNDDDETLYKKCPVCRDTCLGNNNW